MLKLAKFSKKQPWGQISIKFTSITSINFFEDKIEPVRLFEVFDELDDIFMTFAMMKCFDLLENSCSWVARHLFNHLHCKLFVSPDILASPDWGIGSLTKNLSSHNIQLLKKGIHANCFELDARLKKPRTWKVEAAMEELVLFFFRRRLWASCFLSWSIVSFDSCKFKGQLIKQDFSSHFFLF